MEETPHENGFTVKCYHQIPSRLREAVALVNRECFPPGTSEQRAAHADRFCSERDRIGYILAFEKDAVIGQITLFKRRIDYRGQMVVLGGFGGVGTTAAKRNQGVASAMTGLGMEKLKREGCDIAYLCADISDPHLIRLYGRIGFVPLQKPHTYLGRSGKRYTDRDGMLAPVNSVAVFHKVMADPEPFDLGVGNW